MTLVRLGRREYHILSILPLNIGLSTSEILHVIGEPITNSKRVRMLQVLMGLQRKGLAICVQCRGMPWDRLPQNVKACSPHRWLRIHTVESEII